MEEKKEIKVSLGTVICIVIIFLLLMIIGGMYVYYNYIANDSKIILEDGNNFINNANQNSNNNVEQNFNNELNVEIDSELNKLNDMEAKTIIDKFLRIRASYTGSPLELCLFDSELNLNVDYSKQTSDGYVSTSIKYDDFKSEMLKYMSEEIFEKFEMYKNIDGILYAFNGGATGIGYSDIKLTQISNSNNVYRYSVECLEYPPEEGEQASYTFEISYINEKYVVSNYRYN